MTHLSKYQFQKASKKASKLRAAFFGTAGSGKTMSALRVATGLGGPIALIDTERGSASLYADRFSFDTLSLTTRTIEDYCAAIHAAGQGGYNVLIIDSLSHGWQELLTEVDRLAKDKYRGNTWAAWSDGTPKQRLLIDSILMFPGHVIATMRSKTEWVQSDGNNSKKGTPIRVGLAPEQGKGIEYEFSLLLEISTEHRGMVIKDRTGKFQDKPILLPDEAFGKALLDWLNEGEALATEEQQDLIMSLAMDTDTDIAPVLARAGVSSPAGLSQEEAAKTVAWLERISAKQAATEPAPEATPVTPPPSPEPVSEPESVEKPIAESVVPEFKGKQVNIVTAVKALWPYLHKSRLNSEEISQWFKDDGLVTVALECGMSIEQIQKTLYTEGA